MNNTIEKSFEHIISRNKKNYEYDLFKLNSCKYFASYCYLDYIENNYKKYTKEEVDNFIRYISQYPYTLNKQLSPFPEFKVYTFDSSFDNIRNNNPIICYIYKKTYDGINTIHTFILEKDTIYNSWLTTQSVEMKKSYTIDELTGKRKYNDEQEKCSVLMSPTKIYVDNIYNKLIQLLKKPTLYLLKELFGLNKEHIITNFNVNNFKNATLVYLIKE